MNNAQFVTALSVACLTLLIPAGAMLLLRKRGGSWRAFGAGICTFVVAALILESSLHQIVLGSPLGPVLQGSTLLYALYGGIAAGIFEETGRLIAFRVFMKKENAPVDALCFGVGHGGIEAVLITGLGMLSNIAIGVALNSGEALDPAVAEAAAAVAATPHTLYLWALFERLSAICLHVSNSVLVFYAVKQRRYYLYALAVFTHFLMNFAAVCANAHLPIFATELIAALIAALTALAAWLIHRSAGPIVPLPAPEKRVKPQE